MSLSEEWGALCEEHKAARDAHFKAFATVNQRFHAGHNPTDEELDDFEKCWEDWENVKYRMSAFIKRNT